MNRERAITQVAKLSEATVRAMLVDLLTGEEATDADIVGALHANPNRALQVLDQLRIAGPWEHSGDVAKRYCAVTAECLSYIEQDPTDGRWTECGDDGSGPSWATLAEAQAAEHARLTSDGWALASEVTP